jgi:hypothetical protein
MEMRLLLVRSVFKYWLGVVGLSIIAGAFLLIAITVSLHNLAESRSHLEESLQELAQSHGEATRKLEALKVEYETLKAIYDMALELDLTPRIVDTFHAQVERLVDLDDDSLTWRYTPTPAYLTYMICSVVATESGGDISAIGDGGTSFGLTQMKLGTARKYKKDVSKEDLLKLRTHAQLAIQHYVDLLRESNGNHGRVAIKWNRGRNVERLFAMGMNPENGYVNKVYEAATRRSKLPAGD